MASLWALSGVQVGCHAGSPLGSQWPLRGVPLDSRAALLRYEVGYDVGYRVSYEVGYQMGSSVARRRSPPSFGATTYGSPSS